MNMHNFSQTSSIPETPAIQVIHDEQQRALCWLDDMDADIERLVSECEFAIAHDGYRYAFIATLRATQHGVSYCRTLIEAQAGRPDVLHSVLSALADDIEGLRRTLRAQG